MLDLDAFCCPGCGRVLLEVPYEEDPSEPVPVGCYRGVDGDWSSRCECDWELDGSPEKPTLRTETPPVVLAELERLRAALGMLCD